MKSTAICLGFGSMLLTSMASYVIFENTEFSLDSNNVTAANEILDLYHKLTAKSDKLINANPTTPIGDQSEPLPYNPDTDLSTCELARRHGYECESHVVLTEDGYLLTVHRLPCGQMGCEHAGGRGSGQPVFLQHGLLCSSADWLLSGPNKAFAFMLADAGYDVWLGNARGNTYSRRHISIPYTDPEFWNFSWHEMGYYDVPAEIDYLYTIRGTTSTNATNNLMYVGHSMGTTMMFAMLAMRPEYNEKIHAVFAFAPVTYMSHVRSPIRLLAPFSKQIQILIELLGFNEFLPHNQLVEILSKYGCDLNNAERDLCKNIVFLLCGFDKEQYNKTLLPVIMGHTPAGTSTKTVVHYAQEINDPGHFQYFDYGPEVNMQKYGQATPPQYDLTNIVAPIGLFYADNDWLTGPEDVRLLFSEIQRSSFGMYKVPLDKFNHADFVFGIDAADLLYKTVMDMMAKFRP